MHDDDSFVFSSAGTHAIRNQPATEMMQEVGSDHGLDLSPHRATPLKESELPDLVLGMEQHHLIAARHQFPELDASRIRLLDHPNAVVDPYGLDLDTYVTTAAQVLETLQRIDLESYLSPS
jgi:protein-tyrosine-phosphatase